MTVSIYLLLHHHGSKPIFIIGDWNWTLVLSKILHPDEIQEVTSTKQHLLEKWPWTLTYNEILRRNLSTKLQNKFSSAMKQLFCRISPHFWPSSWKNHPIRGYGKESLRVDPLSHALYDEPLCQHRMLSSHAPQTPQMGLPWRCVM
jgi:hypothetical protein